MKRFIRNVTPVVAICFLYANIVWAGGFPSHKLSPDHGRVIEGLGQAFSGVGEEGISRAMRQAKVMDDPSSIFRKVYKRMEAAQAQGKRALLSLYAVILAAISDKPTFSIEGPKCRVSLRDGRVIIKNGQGKTRVLELIGGKIRSLAAAAAMGLVPPNMAACGEEPEIKQISVSIEQVRDDGVPIVSGQVEDEGASTVSDTKDISIDGIDAQEITRGFDNWVERISKMRTGLPPSHVGDTSPIAVEHGFATGLFTYDAAQLALRQVRTGNYGAAKKIVFYFAERFNRYSAEELRGLRDRNNVYGILRMLPSPADGGERIHLINCVDTSSAWDEGNGIIEWYTDGGPQSWLGMAAVQMLMFVRGLSLAERQELEKFVLGLSETILGLFSEENVVSAGPGGQDIDGSAAREHLGHVENMWDHYAFLKQAADYFESRGQHPDMARKYRASADSILQGLKRKNALVRDGDEAYFWQGFQYGNINRQIPADVQSWGIAAVGPKKLNEVFGDGTAEGMLNWLIRHALVTVDYTRPDGYQVTTLGADFSDPYLPDISGPTRGRYGDQGGRGEVRGMITDEWTAGVTEAMDAMADNFYERGETQKAVDTLAMADALRWFAVQRATQVEDMLYWEYATEHGVPTGYGWATPNAYGGSLAGNQVLTGLRDDINPFDPSGETVDSVSKIERRGVSYGIDLLVARTSTRNNFSRNSVMRPGDTPKKVVESKVPFGKEQADSDRFSLLDPSILKKVSYYSAIGENAGKLRTDADTIGIETVASWNSAEVSFTKYLDLTNTPKLTLMVKGSGLRINVVDKSYLLAKDWMGAPSFVQIEVPNDGQWHPVTVDLSTSGADMRNVCAISFDVGTTTTGNQQGTQTYIKDAHFHAGASTGSIQRPDQAPQRGEIQRPSGDGGVDHDLIRELEGGASSARPSTSRDGVDQDLMEDLLGEGTPGSSDRRPQVQQDREGTSVTSEVICSGRCPQSWGGVAFFKDGRWDLSGDDYFEVTVEGRGEFILRLVGSSAGYDNPSMYTGALATGRTHKIYFRDLQGMKENSVKQIGVNVQPNPWGWMRSQGGSASSITIKLVKGGHSQSPKAWAGNAAPGIGAIGRDIFEKERRRLIKRRLGDRDDATDFYFPDWALTFRSEVNLAEVSSTKQGLSYFVVDIQGTEHKIFGIPFITDNGKKGVIVTRKLCEVLQARERAAGQMAAHERFEAAGPAERLQMLNDRYNRLRTIENKKDFASLCQKIGILLTISGQGQITEIEATSSALDNLGHIGGEALEIVDEYLAGGYERLADVLVSNLDATLLGVRLNEILERQVNIDDFAGKLTKPGATRRIVLDLASSEGGINFSVIEEALAVVQTAGDGITTADYDMTTKAVLVLAHEIGWENRGIEKEDIVLSAVILEAYEKLQGSEYRGMLDVRKLMRDIRVEMGRIARMDGSKVNISSPYLHGLIAGIAKMTGIPLERLLRAYYKDLIQTAETEGSRNRWIKLKDRAVTSAVENALVEIGMVRKKGIVGFEDRISAAFRKIVERAFFKIYLQRQKNPTAPRAGRMDPFNMAVNLKTEADPLGIVEDLLLGSPFGDEIGCEERSLDDETWVKSQGSIPLLEVLHLDRLAAQRAGSFAETREMPKRNNLIISLDQLFDIDDINVETRELKIKPKALGIKEKLQQILANGTVRIVSSRVPEQLQGIAGINVEEALSEAVAKYTGIPGLTVEIKPISEVITGIENPQETAVILGDADAESFAGINLDNQLFIYQPRPGELLGSVISVATAVSLDDSGCLSADSKGMIKNYVSQQFGITPGEHDLWQELEAALNAFQAGAVSLFMLPLNVVRLTESLNDLSRYRLTIEIAA